jgi:P-type Na+/K+ transporter
LTGPQNKYLYYSFGAGLILCLITLYVPVLNTSVFKHSPIDWEWGMVIASCFIYIAFAELWKAGKRALRRRRGRL